jgi:hypothetical protein
MPTPFQDAQSAIGFVNEQLRNIETDVYSARYPNFDISQHVDVVTQGSRWATGTTFFSMDGAGESKWIAGKASDFPFVSLDRSRFTRDFYMRGTGYEWDLVEINRALMLGMPLGDEKAALGRQIMEQFKYNVAMVGDTEKNWTGLVNDPLVASYQVPNDGAGSLRTFASKTPDQVARDVNVLLRGVQKNSGEVEWATDLRLPPDQFADISTRKYGAGDGEMTILSYIEKNNVYTAETKQPLTILPMRSLAGVGTGGSDRMMAYRKDKQVVRFHLPGPFEYMEARPVGIMGFQVGGLMATGGVEWRLPGAARYADGI